jgi:hypothetical protein
MNQEDTSKEVTEQIEKAPVASELKSEELNSEQQERISGGVCRD